MVPKTRGVFHSNVYVGLEVAYKTFVGDDAGLIDSVYPLYNPGVDVATRVRDGEEGIFNNHLVWGIFEIDPHVLEVFHWFVEVVVDDACRQVEGPFVGVVDDGGLTDYQDRKSVVLTG